MTRRKFKRVMRRAKRARGINFIVRRGGRVL